MFEFIGRAVVGGLIGYALGRTLNIFIDKVEEAVALRHRYTKIAADAIAEADKAAEEITK